MQILASALPGFRDLRAPLTAGYLWLILLWIALKPDLAMRPTNEVAGSVYDLGKHVGPIWIGLGLSVAAYLIGAVSQALSPTINSLLDRIWQRLYHHYASREFNSDGSKNKSLPKMFLTYHRDPLDKLCDIALNRMYAYQYRNANGDTPNYEEKVDEEASVAREGLYEEIKLPATLLLGKEPELFTEADRLKAEGQFRLSIVPPLTVITVYIALTLSLWWLFIIIPILILLWQSHTRNLEYRYLMFGAIQRGVIDSESVEQFKAWVNSLQPESTSRTIDVLQRIGE